MATNKSPFQKNLDGAQHPTRVLIPVKAGSTAAIKIGEICQVGKSTSGYAAPATSGDATLLVIADEEQKSTDVERMIRFIVPRPGDVFEFALSAARQFKLGETFAISDSQTLVYGTSNVVARIAGDDNCPEPWEESVTRRTLSQGQFIFDEQASYWSEISGNS